MAGDPSTLCRRPKTAVVGIPRTLSLARSVVRPPSPLSASWHDKAAAFLGICWQGVRLHASPLAVSEALPDSRYGCQGSLALRVLPGNQDLTAAVCASGYRATGSCLEACHLLKAPLILESPGTQSWFSSDQVRYIGTAYAVTSQLSPNIRERGPCRWRAGNFGTVLTTDSAFVARLGLCSTTRNR